MQKEFKRKYLSINVIDFKEEIRTINVQTGGEERVGEVFLRRRKRRRHLPKIWTFKKFGQIFFWTDRPTDRHTNRQTLWFIGKLQVSKKKVYGAP